MKRPLTGLVVVYASGIWLGSVVHWPVPALGWIVGSCLVAFFTLCRSRYSLAALLVTGLASGMLAYRWSTTNLSPNYVAHLLDHRDQNIALRGIIVSDPGYRQAEGADAEPTGDRHSFKLELEALNTHGLWQVATGRVLVFISVTREQDPLHYGDRIECTAILRVPPPARNPGTFDWSRWLERQNIQFTATIRKGDLCTILNVARGHPLIALSLRLRERFERALHYGLEGEPQLAGVLAGMIIGERTEIPPQTYADFQRTGVFHIFSVSGLNVTLVAVVVMVLMRLARVPSRWRGLLAIPLLVLYVFATGSRPGAMRALVMAGVVLVGWAVVRPSDILNSLAAAALVILVYDPMQLFDGGFILSFVAVVSLILLTPPIERRLGGWCAPDPLVPRPLAGNWWRPSAFWLVRAVSGSIAAWLGMLPLMALYFNLFSPVSILANVAVIPLLGLITALGMLAMPAYAVWPWLALTFNNANLFLLSMMIRAVEWLSHIPWGHQFVQSPPLWVVAMYYALLALVLNRTLTRRHKRLALTVGLSLFGAAILFIAWPEDVVEITALDLHDGMAVFVNAPGEQHDWLLDGGGDWSGERVVVPYLRAQGVDRLDAIVLTRGDKAHAAGLCDVAKCIPISQAAHGGTGSRSTFFWDWLELVRKRHLRIAALREGDDWMAGRGVQVRVLNPPRESSYDRSDDNAVVLLLEFGPTRLLLTSDTGETVERRLLTSHADVRAHVIIKGRHAIESSCTDDFLDAVRPTAVIQCVSPRPSDRYLQPDVRDRLRQRGVPYYRTDETGAVTIRLTRRGCTLRTCFAAAAPIGKEP